MRLLICAGGTGGGVYPALAVLQALTNKAEAVLWVGGEGGMEADLISRENIPFRAIPAAGIHGVSLLRLPGNILQLLRGYFESQKILREFNPDVLFFTGGFVAIPMALAGTSRESLLYVPDIEPGLALKTIARFADHIALTAVDSMKFFANKSTTICGYPTRNTLQKWTREMGREFLHLNSEKPVILVFGGSKGARSINTSVSSNITTILELAEVIHISGSLDWDMVQTAHSNLSETEKSQYHIHRYLHEMGAALASADLVISRAGASILGEYPMFGLPSILIPYPYAWKYQKVNADTLAIHGAAVVLENEKLGSELLPLIKSLIDQPEKLQKMSEAARNLAMPNAAECIANLLLSLGTKKEISK